MSKINIAERKINIDKLLSEIRTTKCNYIIMNKETLCDLDDAFDDWLTKIETSNYVTIKKVNIQKSYASIWGIPIAICEKLSHGEVEIV